MRAGVWQSLHAILPCLTGCEYGFKNWLRSPVWQVKQTSACVLRARTGSFATCRSWQAAHDTSFVSCGPVCQVAPIVFSWQPRHIAFCAGTGVSESRP